MHTWGTTTEINAAATLFQLEIYLATDNYKPRICHATDGPPKMGPPGPSVANYVAMDGPPDQVRLP